MLVDVPVTVTVPDSAVAGGVPPPLLPPPQLGLAAKRPERITPRAKYRRPKLEWLQRFPTAAFWFNKSGRRQRRPATAIHQPPLHGPRGNNGWMMAVEEAVTVIVAVLLLKVPTEHVTPARELEAVQVKVGVAVKLFIGVKVRVEVPLDPGLMVKVLGAALSEKSGTAIAKFDTLDHVPF